MPSTINILREADWTARLERVLAVLNGHELDEYFVAIRAQ